MIVLDTNVISEAMRPDPEPAVIEWLDRQQPSTTFTTSVTAAELTLGAALLPRGRRRRDVTAAVADALALFDGRVLPFDLDAAAEFGERVSAARALGHQVSTADAQIAAIAAAHGFVVASRDTEPFRALGVDVIDPFEQPPGGAEIRRRRVRADPPDAGGAR